MDKEPFVKWDVLGSEPAPIEFLAVLQRSEYNAGLIRTYAHRTHQHNLLLGELTRLLEPSTEFTKLAITNLETRNLTAAVVEGWKPVLANAISEWAKQRALSSVMDSAQQPRAEANPPAPAAAPAEASEPRQPRERKIETTADELAAFAAIQGLLGQERPVVYEDTASYFKIHLPERRHSTVCRLYFRRKTLNVRVPLPKARVVAMVSLPVEADSNEGWSWVTLESAAELPKIADALRAAWDAQRSSRARPEDTDEPA